MKSKHNQLSIIFAFALLITCNLALKNANDFKSGLFKFNSIPSGVYEIELGSNFDNQYLMAYGDFNGDKYTDMITIISQANKNTVQTISVNLWSTSKGQFVSWPLPQTKCAGKVANIIPGDIDYNGQLDIVVVTLKDDKDYCLEFFKSENCEISGCQFSSIDFSQTFNQITFNTQPMAGDFIGEHFFQLLIFNTQTQTREIFVFSNGLDQPKLIEFKTLISPDSTIDYPTQENFSNVHFSSVVDYNGDCRADLVIQTPNGLEFWTKTETARYSLDRIQTFERNGASLISFNFNDVNFDGSIDFVALVKDTSETVENYDIVIMYNKFSVSSSSLCSKFKSFPYDEISQNGPYVQYQQLNLAVYQNTKGLAPTQIRFADIDWDGMPDIVITQQVARQVYGTPIILMNQSCNGSYCSSLTVTNPRQYTPSTSSNFSDMFKLEAVNVAFFDINEDGKIDFLVNTFSNGVLSIRCFYNYISTDAFFLKALGLNGQCTTSSCQSSIYYGSSYQCKVTTLDTDYKTAAGVQLSQSAHCPLQLPFVILGLARTNNYIENFTVGLSQPDAEDSVRVWTPIIPNSQLIIFPYTQDTSKWEISIFVQPNDALIIVIIVTVAILILLGGIIIYYHRKEKVQDVQGQQEFLKMIR